VNGLTEPVWLLLGAIGALGVLLMLRAMAIRVRNAHVVHDLRVRVAELRARRYLEAMLRHGHAFGEPGEVEVIEDDSPENATPGTGANPGLASFEAPARAAA
jgi:hypothetical protein